MRNLSFYYVVFFVFFAIQYGCAHYTKLTPTLAPVASPKIGQESKSELSPLEEKTLKIEQLARDILLEINSLKRDGIFKFNLLKPLKNPPTDQESNKYYFEEGQWYERSIRMVIWPLFDYKSEYKKEKIVNLCCRELFYDFDGFIQSQFRVYDMELVGRDFFKEILDEIDWQNEKYFDEKTILENAEFVGANVALTGYVKIRSDNQIYLKPKAIAIKKSTYIPVPKTIHFRMDDELKMACLQQTAKPQIDLLLSQYQDIHELILRSNVPGSILIEGIGDNSEYRFIYPFLNHNPKIKKGEEKRIPFMILDLASLPQIAAYKAYLLDEPYIIECNPFEEKKWEELSRKIKSMIENQHIKIKAVSNTIQILRRK